MPHRQQQAGHYLSLLLLSHFISLSLQKMELIIPLNVNVQKIHPNLVRKNLEYLLKNGHQLPQKLQVQNHHQQFQLI
jgi:hypothetical protein